MMRRWLPLCFLAVASVALVGSSSTAARVTAPSTRTSASATDEQVAAFQREVLAAINCEELAIQPGLSDELARSWMLCSLYSLYDAISLAGGVLEGSQLSHAHFWLDGA